MRFSHALASLLGALSLAASAPAGSPAEKLHQLFADHFEWQMREFPREAMARGDYTHADRITDNSLAAIERRHAATEAFLDRSRAIDAGRLTPEDLLNYELFEFLLTVSVEGHRFRMFLAPIGGRFGPHQRIPQMAERVRFNHYGDYANYLKRLEQVPRSVDNTIHLLRLGLAEERTPPRVTLEGVPGQFEVLLEGDGLDALAEPLARMPAHITQSERQRVQRRFETTSLPAVREALQELGEFVTETYVPGCRRTTAASDLPDGEAYYRFQLHRFTTTGMTAREIHELGLSEVARIKAEMIDVIRASDFMQRHSAASSLDEAALLTVFIDYLRTDPRFYHESEESLLAGYRDICKQIDPWLPKLFGVLPRLTYGVREIPDFMAPNQTTAYYSSGDIRNAEPGYFYANTYALDQRPKYEMIPLSLHEAVPGHHFQIALAQELEALPEFRKRAYFTVFGEGWALYTERLGLEMGLYEDPYDNFGRLLYEMWRACRLVVDPGMHALGWSRRQAIDFMMANTALSELNIVNEVDRYIAWPGQATAYKIGELKIRELREGAEQALGKRFDLRAFHDVVLGAGAVPLATLDRRVKEWVNGQRFQVYD
jgi:uncharacterized protein (DUF885 family)